MESAPPILVAVDFSAHSEAALLWACRASDRFGAPLVVLHVVHDPAAAPGYYTSDDRDGHVEHMEEAAGKMLEAFVERIRSGHPEHVALAGATTMLAVGLPPNRIVEVAANLGAGLIAVGSQGRTGLSHLLLGSKALRVAQLSPIPVTIVKAPVDAASNA